MADGSRENLLDESGNAFSMRSVMDGVRRYTSKTCSVKTLKRRLPIVEWLPKYRLELLLQDIIAGISVGLTAIPQGIAYAGVAQLPLQYGLYSGFMGCFVYLIFGSCKDLTIGPTAILALMTQKYVAGFGDDFAVLLTFLSGCVVFLLGLFNLGFLIEFISMPVTSGFTTAAAITIGFTQTHSLLGFSGRSDTFLEVWINFIKHIRTVKLWDSVLGFSTIIFLLLLKKLGQYGSRTCEDDVSRFRSFVQKMNWLISLARNAIVIMLGCLLAWVLEKYGLKPFALTGEVKQGLPPFQLPPFSTSYNGTSYDFVEMVQTLSSSIITIALISVLEAVAIAKAFSNGKIVDSTQEMCALGLCNIVGSFVRSMPTTGSFTRTVVNNASGVQTTLGGIFTGGLVLLSLGFLTSSFYYIPKAVLAGLIITAMIFMVEYEVVVLFWRSRKIELLPFFGTVIACLLIGLEIGITVGAVLNILMILAGSARPKVATELIKVSSQDVLVVTPDDSLLYCSADHFSKAVMKVAFSDEQINNTSLIVLIDGSKVKNIDVTVARNIKVLVETLKSRDQRVFLWRCSPRVEKILTGVHPQFSDMFVHQPEMDEIIKYAGSESLVILTTE